MKMTHSPVVLAGIVILPVAAYMLVACTNQTPAQQAATSTAVAAGLLCLADTSGRVVAVANTSDANSVKAINAAVATGGALMTDDACRTAITAGVAAIPAPGTAGATLPLPPPPTK